MNFTPWEWGHLAIGGVASVIFLFQVLSGAHSEVDAGGADVGIDADAQGDGAADDGVSLSSYLSIRNFVAFFIGYGWVTLACLASGFAKTAASFWGALAGLSFVGASFFLIKTFLRFQEDGSIKLETLVGEIASVYITIGASMSSQGKVMVDTRKGRFELPARTKDSDPLRPGQIVRIKNAEGGILWVTKES
jgi:hypothetical protein